jgi:uncharacterized protein (TIGR02594 family)
MPRARAVGCNGVTKNGTDRLMKCNSPKSKMLAVTAAIAATMILLQTPAEARRTKHKVVRHNVAATMPAAGLFGGILGAGNQYAHLAGGARAPHAARHGTRGQRWRTARRAAPVAAQPSRAWRTARRAAPYASRPARQSHAAATPMAGFGSSSLVAQARSYLGTNPTGMGALWCARFMNMVLEKSGRRGTGSNMAKSFASYGRRVSGPQVGAIAVMSRGRGGGHVGIVSGVDRSGNPIIISGNHNRKVGESVYPRGRIYAYVMP